MGDGGGIGNDSKASKTVRTRKTLQTIKTCKTVQTISGLGCLLSPSSSSKHVGKRSL
jgi:hypothetical protein